MLNRHHLSCDDWRVTVNVAGTVVCRIVHRHKHTRIALAVLKSELWRAGLVFCIICMLFPNHCQFVNRFFLCVCSFLIVVSLVVSIIYLIA